MPKDRARLLDALQEANRLYDTTEVFLMALEAHQKTTLETCDVLFQRVQALKRNHEVIQEALAVNVASETIN